MRFSVVIPTWNRAAPLSALLESLAAQTGEHGGFEVIVADDGSTDETPAVVQRFSGRLDLRRVIQPNRGPAAARNLGAEEARGDLLAFVDSDCVTDPGWLAAMARAADGATNLSGWFGPVRSSAPMVAPFIHAFSLEGEHVPGANLVVPRSAFRALGGFDERLRYAEDNDFSERARAAGASLIYVPDAVVHHPPSVRPWSLATSARPPSVWAMIRYLYKKHPRKKSYEASALRLCVRAGIKLAILAGLPALAWPWLGLLALPLGWLALSARGLANVLRAARAAAAARPPLHLDATDCAAYIAFGWLNDFLELANYIRSLRIETAP